MNGRTLRSVPDETVLTLPTGPVAGHRRLPAHHGSFRRRPASPRCSPSSGPWPPTRGCSCPPSSNAAGSTTPSADEINHVGTVAADRPASQAAQRQRQAAGRGVHRARLLEIEEADDEPFFQVVVQAASSARAEVDRRYQGPDEPRRRAVRALHQALAGPAVRDDALHRAHRRAGTAGRHHRRPPAARRGGETGAAGDRRRRRAGWKRSRRILDLEIEKLRVDKKIHHRVKKQMEKAQKEYYLNEKIKAIQQELGRRDDRVNEIEEFRQQDRRGEDAGRGQGKGDAGAEAASRSCRRFPPRRRSRATTWSGCWRFHGARRSRELKDIHTRRGRSSTRITTDWTRSRSGSSSSWPCASW